MMIRARTRNILAGSLAALWMAASAGAVERVGLRVAGDADGALQAAIGGNSTLKSLEGKADATPGDILAAARGDYVRIVETLYARGYYSVAVQIRLDGREAALIDPLDPPARIGAAEIIVEPGRLFRFGAARIAPLAAGRPLPGAFVAGAPAAATVVRDAAQQAVDDWREAGHAKAEIARQTVLARHDRARLDVDIALAPGPRVRFGEVIVSGETAVREWRIRQIAGIPGGAVFTPDAVEKAATRLRKTGAFKSVQVNEAERVAPDGTMDIGIAVVDQTPRRIGGGLEYSTHDGVTLSGYWLHRNILRGADRLRLDAEIAQIDDSLDGTDYALSFRFERPAVYGPDTLFFMEGGLYYLDEPDHLEEKLEMTVGVSRAFNDRLTGELGIGYSFARVTDRYTLPETRRDLQTFSLPLALTYDSRDNPLDARDGFFLRGALTPYFETFDTQVGAHATLDARAYRALGGQGKGASRPTVLAGRLQMGALVGPGAQDAPPGFLFHSGGGGTVRGQPYKSLDADYGGVRLGGRSFAALSGEIRFPVNARIGLVGFADAGFVSSGLFEEGAWHAGAGLGVRYATPVGPIRFDIAGPVGGSTGDGVHFYVGIGQAF